MPQINAEHYQADIDWDKDGRPVLWIKARGKITAKEVVETLKVVVATTNAGPFEHVCAAYNLLDLQIPFLGRLITAGKVPTTSRTAHFVVGTLSQQVKLAAAVIAVSGNKRLRTVEVCATEEEMQVAVGHWLSLPDRNRAYTISDL
jgi:hypothetical protein